MNKLSSLLVALTFVAISSSQVKANKRVSKTVKTHTSFKAKLRAKNTAKSPRYAFKKTVKKSLTPIKRQGDLSKMTRLEKLAKKQELAKEQRRVEKLIPTFAVRQGQSAVQGFTWHQKFPTGTSLQARQILAELSPNKQFNSHYIQASTGPVEGSLLLSLQPRINGDKTIPPVLIIDKAKNIPARMEKFALEAQKANYRLSNRR